MNKVLVLTMVKTQLHGNLFTAVNISLIMKFNKQKQNRENLRELLDLILVILVLSTFLTCDYA